MLTETEFLKQCLIDEMNNKPILLKLEKQKYFTFGLLLGFVWGVFSYWSLT